MKMVNREILIFQTDCYIDVCGICKDFELETVGRNYCEDPHPEVPKRYYYRLRLTVSWLTWILMRYVIWRYRFPKGAIRIEKGA